MKSLFRLLVFSCWCCKHHCTGDYISGVVSDNDGLPLPGATVLIQGTTTG